MSEYSPFAPQFSSGAAPLRGAETALSTPVPQAETRVSRPRRKKCPRKLFCPRTRISSERVTAGRPVNAKCRWGSGRPSFGRRLARVGTLIRQISSRLHLLQRHTCPSASRNHCTSACRAVLAGHNACVERGGAMRVRLRIENVLLQAGTRMRVYVHGATTGAILIPLPAFTLPALGLCLLWPP